MAIPMVAVCADKKEVNVISVLVIDTAFGRIVKVDFNNLFRRNKTLLCPALRNALSMPLQLLKT
jgi:hypothetical protein